MSKFFESLTELAGKKVRFFVGGGESGFVQGPVKKIEGDLIFLEKDGDIRGTRHIITVSAAAVRYYEMDELVEL